MDLEFAEERCVQFRDLIPQDTMTSGRFRYEVRVLDRGDEVESRTFEFFVDDGDSRDAVVS